MLVVRDETLGEVFPPVMSCPFVAIKILEKLDKMSGVLKPAVRMQFKVIIDNLPALWNLHKDQIIAFSLQKSLGIIYLLGLETKDC